MGFRSTQLLHVAASLGIPDRLSDSPKTALDLATQLQCVPTELFRLMRALASIGVLNHQRDGAFSLASKGHLLRSDVQGSLRNIAILYGQEWLWDSYGRMIGTLRTGKTAFEIVHSKTFYEFLADNRVAGEVFNQAMSDFSDSEADSIANAYDFSKVNSVVDIGGGHGHLVRALLEKYVMVSAIVFDLPQVATSVSRFESKGLDSRLDFAGGDFFNDKLPTGDVYILKSVLHNWNDEMSARILNNCRRSMGKNSRLLIIERIIKEESGFDEGKLFDINMMTIAGGQERSVLEYRHLLDKTGLRIHKIIETASYLQIIEVVVK